MLLGYLIFKQSGRDEMQRAVYRPLQDELKKLRFAVEAKSYTDRFVDVEHYRLANSEVWRTAPADVRLPVDEAYATAQAYLGHVPMILSWVEQDAPEYVRKIKTPNDDKQWNDASLDRLNTKAAKEGVEQTLVSFKLSHAGYGPGFDIRDAKHLKISNPALVLWDLNDWLRYPSSIVPFEGVWTKDSWLGFHPTSSSWAYRLSHDDFARHGVSLEQFLAPMHASLRSQEDFQILARSESDVLARIDKASALVDDRERDPKRLSDLVGWSR
jgi:hypothetical protein